VLAKHPKFLDMSTRKKLFWAGQTNDESFWEAALSGISLEFCLTMASGKTFPFWMGLCKHPEFTGASTESICEWAKYFPHWYLWAKIAQRSDVPDWAKELAKELATNPQ
jgi:hypothetical protein